MPSGSTEALVSNWTVSGSLPEVGVAEASAVGATLGTTLTWTATVELAPSSSTTVSSAV